MTLPALAIKKTQTQGHPNPQLAIGLYTCRLHASPQRPAFRNQMARSPPRGASEEDWSDRRLRRAFSSREKTDHDTSGIGWVARCMRLHGLHGFHGVRGALEYLAPLRFCANQKIPRAREGRHRYRYRHIRQSAIANLGTPKPIKVRVSVRHAGSPTWAVKMRRCGAGILDGSCGSPRRGGW